MAFFADQFVNEPEESQALILEKLLLSIRTVTVQEAILSFIDRHYEHMSPALRHSFYVTFMEMLAECDGLSVALISIVNHHIESEDPAAKEKLAQMLTDALETDYRKKEHRLLPVLTAQRGFCEDVVIRLAFGPWQSRKIYAEYLQLLIGKPISEKTSALRQILKLVPEAGKVLLPMMSELYPADDEKNNLYVWLTAAAQLQELPADFADALNKAVIAPNVCARALDVFDLRLHEDGMDLLEKYADGTPTVRASDHYRLISTYQELIRAAEQVDLNTVTARMHDLMQSGLGKQVSSYLAKCGIAPNRQPQDTVVCLEIVQGCLKGSAPELDTIYRKRSGGEPESAAAAMEQLLRLCGGLCQDEAVAQLLCSEASTLPQLVAAFSADYGKGAQKWLRVHSVQEPLSTALATVLAQQKSSGSLLSRLFGRRNK